MEEKKIKGKQKVKSVKKKEPNKIKNETNNKLVEENAKLNEKLLRVMAEMQNMKRRNDEEISKLCKYDGEKLITKILPIVDNFKSQFNSDIHKMITMKDEINLYLDLERMSADTEGTISHKFAKEMMSRP